MIGHEPLTLDWVVSRGQGLTYLFETTDDEPFPDDTVLSVYVYGPRNGEVPIGLWPAVGYEPGAIQVQIESEDLDVIPDGSTFQVFLEMPGFPRVCWYRGRVWRRD